MGFTEVFKRLVNVAAKGVKAELSPKDPIVAPYPVESADDILEEILNPMVSAV